MYYAWKRKEDLSNKKTGPKNPWWALKNEKIIEVIKLKESFKEFATNYILGIKAQISASSVGRILKKYWSEEEVKKIPKKELKTCEWLNLHVCWSIDSIYILSKEGYVYIQLLLEEYSRFVLGYVIGHKNTAEKAKVLLENAIAKTGTTPLVLKFDRGSEFKNEEMELFLKEKEITPMPSPKHYPLFNGKEERQNRIFKKFFKKRGILTVAEICGILDKAMHDSNYEINRRIFGGKTSADIFNNAQIYKKEDKDILIQKTKERILEIESIKNPRWDKYDIVRKAVVKCVVDLGLCSIKTGGENDNQFSVQVV